MGEAHGGFGAVHVLAAGATGPEHIDLQILLGDVHIDGVIQLRAHVNGRETGVPALGGIEGGNPHQAMDTCFRAQISVGVRRGDNEGDTLDARFVAVLVVDHFRLPALGLAEAQIHPEQHGGPVAALRAARAGRDGDDGVGLIHLATEHHAQFRRLDGLS